MPKKEIDTFEAAEGLVIGHVMKRHIVIEITRVIGLSFNTENICIDEECEKVELNFYQADSWTDCDLTFKVNCKKCYGSYRTDQKVINPIFTDKSIASYENMEVINELGLAKAVLEHFKEHHLEFYHKLLEEMKEE